MEALYAKPNIRSENSIYQKRNEVCAAIRKAKFDFECKLAENI